MRNLCLILKNNFNEAFGISRFRFEKEPGRRVQSLCGNLVRVGLLLLVINGAYLFGRTCAGAGYASAIPLLGYIIGTVLSFVAVVLKINESLAGKEDAEVLLAMPIPVFTQVLAIFLDLYLWNLILVLITNVPMILSYAQAERTGMSFWILWGIGVFMTSLPVTGVAALIGTFLALVLAGVKNSNLLHSVITLGVFVLAAVLLINIGDGIGQVWGSGADAEELLSVIVGNYKLGAVYQQGVVEQRLPLFVLFLLLSAIWHLFFLFFMGIAYEEVIQALREPKTYRNYEYTVQKKREMEKTLFEKELRQWLYSRSYLVSSLLGVLVALLLSFTLLIRGAETLFAQFGLMQFYENFQRALPYFLSIWIGASCTTYCSYSIERQRHWVMETLPMEEKMIRKSKRRLNLMITLPAAVVCALLCGAAFRPGILLWIWYILFTVCYAFVSAWWGLMIDLRFADYSASSEDQALRGNLSFFAGWLPGVVLPAGIFLAVLII